MPGRPRQEVEETAKRLAVGYVAMENGLWLGDDGQPLLDEHGNPKVVKRKLLDAVGLSTDKCYRYFEDPPSPNNHAALTFWREVAIERNRVRMGMRQQLASLRPEIKQMGEAFLLELWGRFKAAPQSFSNTQLARLGPELLKLGLTLEAAGQRQQKLDAQTQIAANLEELRERLKDSPELYTRLVNATRRLLIQAADDVADLNP